MLPGNATHLQSAILTSLGPDTVQEREKAQAKFVEMSLHEVEQQAAAQPVLMIPEARPGEAAEPAEMTAAQRMAVQVRSTLLLC